MKDPWSWIATIGPLMVQWVMAHASSAVGLLMGLGGVITFYFGIKEKIKKNKLLDMQIKEEEEQRERRQRRYKLK
jgi:hypothetical protein